MRKRALFGVCGLMGMFLAPAIPALAQGFGEARPLQFRTSNNGLTLEVYRRQLGATASASATASSSGGTGTGQSGSAVNNAVDTTRYLNINITGENNVLNVVGETINAQQTSTGTEQSSANEQISSRLNK